MCSSLLQTSLLNQRALIVSQIRSIGDEQSIANKACVGTGQKHLDRRTARSRFNGSDPANLLELFNCGVLRIGNT
jgi:hypothetical protein